MKKFVNFPDDTTPLNAENLNQSPYTVLYDNESGSSEEEITLNDSVSNYEYIEMFVGKQAINNGVFSIKVPNPNQKYVQANLIIGFATEFQIKYRTYYCNENKITINNQKNMSLKTSGKIEAWDDTGVLIYKVIGYPKTTDTVSVGD